VDIVRSTPVDIVATKRSEEGALATLS
jgi:hypothetical protein